MSPSITTLLKQTARFRRSPIKLRQLPAVLLKRGVRRMRRSLQSGNRTGLAESLATAGMPFGQFLERSWARDRQYVQLRGAVLEELRRREPERVARTTSAAERLLGHEFDLLGSGPFVPRDPDRRLGPDGYLPIDWYLDPVSGLRFPRGIPHGEWDLYAMRPGNADIKLPWELARCQHWPTLGQAYRLTGDPRYAHEIARQQADFDEANPTGSGINWTCTMDVALRAVSWVLGLALVRGCQELPEEFWRAAYGSLYDHGRFIRNNLENTYEVTSNHYLSNIVGLYFLGKAFQLLPEGAEWEAYSFDSLHREIEVQTLEDGADFESSVPYHRLVTELFMSCSRLGELTGTPFSESYRARLRAMVEYLAAVIRPDGLMPQLGDADDGRGHILTDYGSWDPQDGRHLFAPAALHLDHPGWLAAAGEGALWEAAWWGFELPPELAPAAPASGRCRLYAEAGVAVMREGGNLLLITNGIVGTKGFGNHKHNDQLSFEVHFEGQPVVVDPGSYVYTSDPDARNRFRATAYHNTLAVDGEEQNEFNPEWLFRMFETAKPEHLELTEDGAVGRYRGRHSGYLRLDEGVIHERRFRYHTRTGLLAVLDLLEGSGSHLLRWHFHLAPGVEAQAAGDGLYELRAAGRSLALAAPPGCAAKASEAWYSPSYGVRRPCVALDFELETTVGEDASWLFVLGPRAGFPRGAGALAELRSEMLAQPEAPR